MTIKATSVDVVSTLIAIQKREGMTDSQFAETIGYKNRVSWQRIKSRRAPVNEKLLYRAIHRWPELEKILSSIATIDSNKVTGDSPTEAHQNAQNQRSGVFRRVIDKFIHPSSSRS